MFSPALASLAAFRAAGMCYRSAMETSSREKLGGEAERRLRKGWTTGACATAAAVAAYEALVTEAFPNPVGITLPKGETPAFPLVDFGAETGAAWATIRKDAGDDPDITHGALITARLAIGAVGTGIRFHAGPGVGTVTKPGLPLPPGEPAINPAPREMIAENLSAAADRLSGPRDLDVTISIKDGEKLAEKTWNPRLGIVGGLSVLGTTGVVIPYSCSAWIHSIHRGIDVAAANGFPHVAAATGKTSEAAARALHGLPLEAMIDMGDFAGGMLKYLRKTPLPRVTIAGGFAKLVKLGQGALDLHSSRSQVDFTRLADTARTIGVASEIAARIAAANTAAEALSLAGPGSLADAVARQALATALAASDGRTGIDILVVGRDGSILARTDTS